MRHKPLIPSQETRQEPYRPFNARNEVTSLRTSEGLEIGWRQGHLPWLFYPYVLEVIFTEALKYHEGKQLCNLHQRASLTPFAHSWMKVAKAAFCGTKSVFPRAGNGQTFLSFILPWLAYQSTLIWPWTNHFLSAHRIKYLYWPHHPNRKWQQGFAKSS